MEYFIINFILLLVFIISGKNVSKGGSYISNAIACCIFFVLVFGSRYNRGHDYAHYVEVYTYSEHSDQYVFWLYNYFLKNFLGISKYYIFYFYAIPFIICAFIFLRNFKKYSEFSFPLFLVSMTYFEEYEIRQALGFSFVFLFLDEFYSQHKKIIKVLLMSFYTICVFNIHSANIFFIIIFIAIIKFHPNHFNYKISIIVLIFCAYAFINFYDFSYVSSFLGVLSNVNDKFAHYTTGNAAEMWFGESAFQLENKRNPIVLLGEIFGNSSLIYFSYKITYVEKGRDFEIFANLFILGECGRRAFLYLELLSRMSGLFERMYFLPLSFVLYNIKWKELRTVEKVMYLSMVFVIYDYLKYLLFPNELMTSFLWNKN